MFAAKTILTWQNHSYIAEEMLDQRLPMVEIFETIEGEGLSAGYPTVFVRLFHCNLRCTWCDTPYSFAPSKPAFEASITEIVDQVQQFASKHICLTGGEPLIHRQKSMALIQHLAALEQMEDIHIETNGAIPLQPFTQMRKKNPLWAAKVRFIMDYKLPDSGEMDKMIVANFAELEDQDEIKFVIGSDEDFEIAREVIAKYHRQGVILMSPVWETMPPQKLVDKVLKHRLSQVKISMQLHKIIWDPSRRGV